VPWNEQFCPRCGTYHEMTSAGGCPVRPSFQGICPCAELVAAREEIQKLKNFIELRDAILRKQEET